MPDSIKHRGVHHLRTQDPDNVLEKAMALLWETQNESTQTLLYLMNTMTLIETPLPGGNNSMNLGAPTQRDATVAASIIQWLGTTMGDCFLREAFANAGYKVSINEIASK